MKALILKSTKEGDVILDCFAGSGSTLVACKELSRNFIGIELSPEYYIIANDRIKKGTTNSIFERKYEKGSIFR